MAFDELTVRTAIAWRDLRRFKSQQWSEPLPQGQLDTMDVLAQRGPCSMVELRTALRIDASTATRAVDRLVDSGMAVRRRSEDDARTVIVKLTAKGHAIEQRLTAERLGYMDRILRRFSGRERKQLVISLEQLVAAADAVNAELEQQLAKMSPTTER